jgi:hypothetical protein
MEEVRTMRSFKFLTVLVSIIVFAGLAFAKTVYVKMQYTTGSYGQYRCFLYRDGGAFLWKDLSNNGAGGGTAAFDNVPSGKYNAIVYCLNDGRRAWTDTKTLYWFMSSVTLTGRI